MLLLRRIAIILLHIQRLRKPQRQRIVPKLYPPISVIRFVIAALLDEYFFCFAVGESFYAKSMRLIQPSTLQVKPLAIDR